MSWKIVVLAAAAMTVAAIAFGASGGSGGVTLCAGKGGDLSLGKHGKCAKHEKKITIAKRGPQGEQGVQGPPGKDGTPEDLAPEAVHLVSVATGDFQNDDCISTPGSFCGNDSGNCGTWQNVGDPNMPVGYRKDSGGWVHLQGTALLDFQGACGGTPSPPGVFNLPAGYRPAGGASFAAPNCYSAGDNGVITISANGLVQSAGGGCTSLDGVVFHP
jgi:hypothetical protein